MEQIKDFLANSILLAAVSVGLTVLVVGGLGILEFILKLDHHKEPK